MNRFIEKHFILVIILLAFFALCTPGLFTWLKSFIPALLGLIMFGIGMTLDYRDFKINSKKVGTLLLVSLIKFFLMSSSAFIIAKVLHLTLYDFIGLVIVGTCPGGTAANVMSYFSKSNTTLTIILTFITTLVSPLLMPLLSYLFLHKYVYVPVFDIIETTASVILIPILIGTTLKHYGKDKIRSLVKILPSLSIFSIALVIACVVALNASKILLFPMLAISAVILNNVLGYAFGYVIGKIFNLPKADKQSLAFEYGMQDSGLGVMIATSFFNPAAALIGALFSIIQNITGIFLVKFFKFRNKKSNCSKISLLNL